MPNKSLKKESDVGIMDREKDDLQPPKKFKVVLLNDDYTPMDFVAKLLITIFHKDPETALAITMSVHNSGKGIAGVYSKEIAETKSSETNMTAKQYGYPLLSEIEST